LETGHAYKCYVSKEELEAMRRAGTGYDRRWRERSAKEAPDDPKADYTVRIKAPMGSAMTIHDHIQGEVTIDHDQLDDFILLRADGTPTYMLSVVVDDHDMDVTHVIRGDDHLMNAFRQRIIFEAMGWPVPEFAHAPLIHGSDGKKLSKRHGALGVMEYHKMGYLPEALNNYLLRLGWSHGDDEIIPRDQAIEWFDLEHIGKSPSQFDVDKLNFINRHYLENADDGRLTKLALNFMRNKKDGPIRDFQTDRLKRAMNDLKGRSDTIAELADDGYFLVADRPLEMTEKATEVLDAVTIKRLNKLADKFESYDGDDFDSTTVKMILNNFTDEQDIGLGKIGQPLRAALTGSVQAPGIFDIPAWLGRQETVARIRDLNT
jgi:glutamyl-tRNA synthetase